jgi:hypothetical protein
MSTYRIILLDH